MDALLTGQQPAGRYHLVPNPALSMASAARKRGRTAGGGAEEIDEPAPVAAGFEAPIFGAHQVATLTLEGEDGPLGLTDTVGVASDHAGLVCRVQGLAAARLGGRARAPPASDVYYRNAASRDGSAVFVADNGNHTIWRVELATGAMTTVAGSGEAGDADGVGDAADFCDPAGIAISPDGGALYVADFNNFARSGAWRWRLAR